MSLSVRGVNSNKFGNKPVSNYATERSQAKERQNKDETITGFILIIGCKQSGVVLLILVRTVNT